MNLIGRYDNANVELTGSRESLSELAHVIKSLAGPETLKLSVPPTPASPYLGYLESIRLEPDSGYVCVSRRDRVLTISGSPEKLSILASNIDYMAHDRKPGESDHLHIEYYPGHFYLSEHSDPLVVARDA